MQILIDISEHEWEYLNKLVANGDQLGHYERLLVGGEPIQEPKTDIRECGSCKYCKDGHRAGTEECHLCMWESQYKPRTGHWIKSNIGGAKVCSECHSHMGLSNFKYCPNCGVKMVKLQESEG